MFTGPSPLYDAGPRRTWDHRFSVPFIRYVKVLATPDPVAADLPDNRTGTAPQAHIRDGAGEPPFRENRAVWHAFRFRISISRCICRVASQPRLPRFHHPAAATQQHRFLSASLVEPASISPVFSLPPIAATPIAACRRCGGAAAPAPRGRSHATHDKAPASTLDTGAMHLEHELTEPARPPVSRWRRGTFSSACLCPGARP